MLEIHNGVIVQYDSDSGDFFLSIGICLDAMSILIRVEKCDVVRILVANHTNVWGLYHPDSHLWVENAIKRHRKDFAIPEFVDIGPAYQVRAFRQAFECEGLNDHQVMLVAKEMTFSGDNDTFMDSEEFQHVFFREFEGGDEFESVLEKKSVDEIKTLVEREEVHRLFDVDGNFKKLDQMEVYRKLTPWIPRKEEQ